MKQNILFLTLAILFSVHETQGQVVTVTNNNALELAQKLAGPGVVVSNASITGASGASGTFTATNSNIGLNSGIVLASGNVVNIPGTASQAMSNSVCFSCNDPDLLLLANMQAPTGGGVSVMRDVVVLEFDVYVTADTLKFNYVFGSKEYPNYVCSNYNDAFGFFISGPGINGPFSSNSENIALIPGTTTPVSINTINGGGTSCPSNSAYYINNSAQSTQHIRFNGYTTVLTAVVVVQPCNTYTLRLKIGDATDQLFDSGVFIEEGSLVSTGLYVKSTTSVGRNFPYAIPGCTEGIFTFSTTDTDTVDRVFHYTIAGSAVNGVDYNFIPDSIIIPANDSVANLTITPIIGQFPTEKTITLYVPDPCTGLPLDSTTLIIRENIEPVAGGDTTICQGDNTPIFAGGGVTYQWFPSSGLNNDTLADPVATPLVTTTYTVGVTVGSCTEFDSVTVELFPVISPDAGEDQFICFNQTAVIGGTPAASGGVPPYSFTWSPSSTLNNGSTENPVASPATTQSYTLTVTDSIGCSANDDMTVEVSLNLFVNAGNDQVICSSQEVTLGGNPSASGGLPPYIYSWAPAYALDDSTIANPKATPLTTTTYTLTVTDVAGCTETDEITITVQPSPSADAGQDHFICFNQDSVVLGGTPSASGGTPPFNYSWIPVSGLNDPAIENPLATPSITTTYTLTVTDDNGCVATDEVHVTVQPVPSVDAGQDQTVCNGISVVIGGSPVVSGGTAPFQYNWSPGASLDNDTLENPTALPSTNTTYTLNVVDVNGCTASDDITVFVNQLPIVDAGSDQEICLGQNQAILGGNPSGSGGILPYSYHWIPAAGLNNDTLENPVATPDTTTTYTLTITDGNGCSASDEVIVTVNPIPVADAGTDNEICFQQYGVNIGGNPTASGGTAPFSYSWEPVAGLDNSSTSNPLAEPLATTIYTLTLTDIKGCVASDEVTVMVNPIPVADAGPDQTICFEQFVGIGAPVPATGGTPPYNYSWTPSSGLDNDTIGNPVTSPSSTTVYTLTITDEKGCIAIDEVQVNVNPLPVVDAGMDQEICFSQQQVLIGGSPSSSGGLPPYNYNWAPVSGLNSDVIANPVAAPNSTTTYTLTVTDDNGCMMSDEVTVVVNPLPIAYAGPDQTICDSDSTIIGGIPGASSGTPPFTYEWFPAGSLDDPFSENPLASPFDTTLFTLTITDSKGCVATDQMVLNVNPTPLADAGTDRAICLGQQTVIIGGGPAATGGTSPYSFSWEPVTNLSDPAIANPVADPDVFTNYTLTVTDVNGCYTTDVVNIDILPLPAAFSDAGVDNTICLGYSIPLGGNPVATGGTPPYIYNWIPNVALNNNSLANPTASPTSTTSYTLTVTDDNGCTATDDVTVNLSIPQADAGADTAVCAGSPVQIGGSPAGFDGTPPYNYSWSPAMNLNSSVAANPVASPPSTTVYQLSVTDDFGCVAIDQVTITTTPEPVVDAGTDEAICTGSQVVIGGFPTVQSGTPPFTYQWSNGTSLDADNTPNPTASPIATTTYSLHVSDAAGCSGNSSVTVTVNSLPIVDAGADKEICEGLSAMLGGNSTAIGGKFPYTYSWQPSTGLNDTAISNPQASPLTTTNYTLTVKDANSCQSADQIRVTVNPSVSAHPGNDHDICEGKSATIGGAPTATAGTPPYTYDWNPGFAMTDPTVSNPVVNPPVNTIYTLTVTDAKGCTESETVKVNVNLNPQVNAGEDRSICHGETMQLGANPTATGGTAPYHYSWLPAIGLSANDIENPDATPGFTTTYSLIVEDQAGCTGEDNVTITVNPAIYADAGGEITACRGEMIRLGGNPAGSGGSGTLIYSWAPATGLSAGNVPNPEMTVSASTTYTLTITDQSGCEKTAEAKITMLPLPAPEIVDLEGTYCLDGVQVELKGTPEGGTFSGPGIMGTTFHPQAAGTGHHTITYSYSDPAGCKGEIAREVSVTDLPGISTAGDVTVKLGESRRLEATGPQGTSYTWEPELFLDNPYSRTPIVTPTETITYTITGYNLQGCASSAKLTVTLSLDIDITAPNVFTPDGDGINDTWRIPDLDFFPENHVRVYNRWGQLVFEQVNYNDSNAWDGGGLPEGTYYWIIEIPGKEKVFQGFVGIVR